MTDEERRAVQWLDLTAKLDISHSTAAASARTIRAMLARPVMPEEPSEDAIATMIDVLVASYGLLGGGKMRAVYRALYQHLSAPKKRWRLTHGYPSGLKICVHFDHSDAARLEASRYIEQGATSVTIEEVTT